MRSLLILILFILPTPAVAQTANAGFVDGLWYDKAEVFAGVPVRIYSAVRNNTGADLTGTIEFFVNDVRIERTEVQALDGRIIESWADWRPVYGTSTVKATLSHTRLSPVGSSTQTVTVLATESLDSIFVDHDTDDDGVGNLTDTDDDGDGVLDTEDAEPLLFNEPEVSTEEPEPEDQSSSGATESTQPKGITEPKTGLEQFIDSSAANQALGGLTQTINSSKQQLDAYREARSQTAAEERGPDDQINVSEETASSDTFGEITRTQSDEDQSGFIGNVISLTKIVVERGYTFFLFILSVMLGHPALVQLLLLLCILYLVYRLARRFGRRDI